MPYREGEVTEFVDTFLGAKVEAVITKSEITRGPRRGRYEYKILSILDPGPLNPSAVRAATGMYMVHEADAVVKRNREFWAKHYGG